MLKRNSMDITKVTVRKIANWLSKKSIVIVIIISIFHIGLTYIHTRESGRADLIPFSLLPILQFKYLIINYVINYAHNILLSGAALPCREQQVVRRYVSNL